MTYIVFDDKLGSDVFLRLLRFLFCDNLSLNDSERLTETGADFALTLTVCSWLTFCTLESAASNEFDADNSDEFPCELLWFMSGLRSDGFRTTDVDVGFSIKKKKLKINYENWNKCRKKLIAHGTTTGFARIFIEFLFFYKLKIKFAINFLIGFRFTAKSFFTKKKFSILIYTQLNPSLINQHH